MEALLQVLIATLSAWFVWRLIRRMLRPRAPAEPADDPLADVSAPVRRGPKGLAGAVAVEEPEPEDDDHHDAYPPRSL